MKFRNPETGEIFEDIVAARFSFCNQKCKTCSISCWNNTHKIRCDIYCNKHTYEAALLMGYETLQ